MKLSPEPPELSENPVAELDQLISQRVELLDSLAKLEGRIRELRQQVEQRRAYDSAEE